MNSPSGIPSQSSTVAERMASQTGDRLTAQTEPLRFSPRAVATPSYRISIAKAVRLLGPAARLSMFEGGGERAHYQYIWDCGCVVLELDDRCRIEPCDVHLPTFGGRA